MTAERLAGALPDLAGTELREGTIDGGADGNGVAGVDLGLDLLQVDEVYAAPEVDPVDRGGGADSGIGFAVIIGRIVGEIVEGGDALGGEEIEGVDETGAAVLAVVDLIVDEGGAEDVAKIEVVSLKIGRRVFDVFLKRFQAVGERPADAGVLLTLEAGRRELVGKIAAGRQLGAGERGGRERDAAESGFAGEFQAGEDRREVVGVERRKAEQKPGEAGGRTEFHGWNEGWGDRGQANTRRGKREDKRRRAGLAMNKK